MHRRQGPTVLRAEIEDNATIPDGRPCQHASHQSWKATQLSRFIVVFALLTVYRLLHGLSFRRPSTQVVMNRVGLEDDGPIPYR